ncbi:hypothetical protein TrRE_jg11991 [Triparma retinervis]|uniref:RING-type E3 ubiquitin transferase n=1 Tax=Triparma retinervis TaxID=2557542 RepID=A0A9W7EBN3_9STRA|nr:hypothetical protein TrRE_jg11991 [Triparma retinervis]
MVTIEQDIETYLQQLSQIHREEIGQMRAARRHKLLALLCFLFFIVLRLWVLAIYEKDFTLMTFCSLCTLATFHMWRRGTRENMSHDLQIAATLRELVAAMDLESGRGGSRGPGSSSFNGVGSQSKSRWQRFLWSEQGDSGGGIADNGKTQDDALQQPQEEESTPDEVDHQTNREAELCSICLCEYENCNSVVRLPCDHLFHDDCLDKWVQNNFRCPLCNEDLRSEEEIEQSAQANQSLIQIEEQRRLNDGGIMIFRF